MTTNETLILISEALEWISGFKWLGKKTDQNPKGYSERRAVSGLTRVARRAGK
jgi:hypothetical protein